MSDWRKDIRHQPYITETHVQISSMLIRRIEVGLAAVVVVVPALTVGVDRQGQEGTDRLSALVLWEEQEEKT